MKANYKISMYYDDYIVNHQDIIAYDLESKGNSIIFYTNKETLDYLNINNLNYVIERNIKEKIKKVLLLKKFVLFGIIIIGFGIYLNAYRVQNVIFNIETPINNEIKTRIETSHKKVFFFDFSNIDYQQLSKDLRSEYSCYEWISVTKNYDVIEVEIIKTGLDNNYVDDLYGNIVATKDGIIETYLVTGGDILVTRNQYVKQGDILIQGSYYDKTVTPKGVILAHTFETQVYQVPKVIEETQLTGEKESYYRLNIINNIFDLKSNYIYNEYSEESIEVFKMPFLFTVYKVNRYNKQNIIYNNDIDSAIEYGYSKVEEHFNKTKVLDEEEIETCMLLTSIEYDDYYEVTYLVKKIESIGKFEEMIQ
ncbi:MAG: sporulation protein YqfD [bacterium]